MRNTVLFGFIALVLALVLVAPVQATNYVSNLGAGWFEDDAASYTPDELIGLNVQFTSGALNGQTFEILDNTETIIIIKNFDNDGTLVDWSFETAGGNNLDYIALYGPYRDYEWVKSSVNAESQWTDGYDGTYAPYLRDTGATRYPSVAIKANLTGVDEIYFRAKNIYGGNGGIEFAWSSYDRPYIFHASPAWGLEHITVPEAYRIAESNFVIDVHGDPNGMAVDCIMTHVTSLSEMGLQVGDTYQILGSEPIAGFHASPTSGDAPLDVKFLDDSVNGNHWLWFFGDGYYTEYDDDDSPYYGGGPWHTFYEPGSYTIKQCVSNEFGEDWENKTNYIQVGEQPEQELLAYFSATPLTGGNPLTVKFTDESTGDPNHWLWYFGDGFYTEYDDSPYPPYTSGGPTHIYHDAGTYTVKLQIQNTTSEDWENKTGYITVLGGAPPYADWFASPDTGPAPLDVKFWDDSSGSPTYWKWDFGDGFYTEYDNSIYSNPYNSGGPWHTFQNPGTYEVTMWASNEYGEDAKAGYITVTNATEGTLTIYAIDATTRALIHSAHVEVEGGGETLFDENFDGTYSCDLPLGAQYHITVSASGYYEQDFQFVLTESMTMTVALIREGTAPEGKSSIDFVVRSNATAAPLPAATVTLGSYGTLTDQYGTAHFEVSNTSGTLEWVVSKTGFFAEQGSVDTSTSQTIEVTLFTMLTPTTTTATPTPTTTETSPNATGTIPGVTPTKTHREAARESLDQAYEFVPQIFGLVLLILFLAIMKRGMK
jgi:PKD repeat protein